MALEVLRLWLGEALAGRGNVRSFHRARNRGAGHRPGARVPAERGRVLPRLYLRVSPRPVVLPQPFLPDRPLGSFAGLPARTGCPLPRRGAPAPPALGGGPGLGLVAPAGAGRHPVCLRRPGQAHPRPAAPGAPTPLPGAPPPTPLPRPLLH